MNITNIIKSRRSIRAFLDKPLDRDIISECLEAAIWAPSATNQQPWEFAVVTGDELTKISDDISANFAQKMQGEKSFPEVPEENRIRQEEIFTAIAEASGKDGVDGATIFQNSLAFFHAPCAVFFLSYKDCDNQCLLSVAAAVENFLIAASSKGLGTCWLGIPLICADDIASALKLSAGKEIIAAVAVGYPDNTKNLNLFQRQRVPVEKLTKWYGFE